MLPEKRQKVWPDDKKLCEFVPATTKQPSGTDRPKKKNNDRGAKKEATPKPAAVADCDQQPEEGPAGPQPEEDQERQVLEQMAAAEEARQWDQ